MTAMGLHRYYSNELFIYRLVKTQFKVLLHNGNIVGSLPIAHSTKVKEEDPTIALVSNEIDR